jgi:hypothetical protein
MLAVRYIGCCNASTDCAAFRLNEIGEFARRAAVQSRWRRLSWKALKFETAARQEKYRGKGGNC